MFLEAIVEAKGCASIWRKDHSRVRELNDRLMMAERAFTDRDGLSGRPWYKHLVQLHRNGLTFPLYFTLQIYAPSRHNDYGSNSFPGIEDAILETEPPHCGVMAYRTT
ncbi:hypothetical protein Pint_13290 [Pistacia integerrima]|uniref:Uncharacterized protein n=1 Tax=Pistacia integerrima TaxID=434235 RepID=A0ACC0Y8N7_9ROSI|nr:hypothetical protein Pint_13290 [Pistacia integerrima]